MARLVVGLAWRIDARAARHARHLRILAEAWLARETQADVGVVRVTCSARLRRPPEDEPRHSAWRVRFAGDPFIVRQVIGEGIDTQVHARVGDQCDGGGERRAQVFVARAGNAWLVGLADLVDRNVGT